MNYELLNKLLKDVTKENYTKIGNIEYCYLQECTYAVRKVGNSFPILLKARSPEQALNSFIQR
jgi:hypothetical protein